MHLIEHLRGESIIHRLDPRFKIVAAVIFAVIVAVSQRPLVPGLGLGAALALFLLAGIGWRAVITRLAELNLFLLLVIVLLPFSASGEALFQMGSLAYSREGFLFACVLAIKGNAIVIMLTVMLSTVETISLGHALSHLGLPDKLIHLFLFTVRYIDVLHHEYLRLAAAMKTRGFRPGANLHTCRSLGYLVAVLLIRSLDRSERIMAAMKCRGFTGRFYVLEHLAAARRDVAFGCLAGVGLAGLVWLEWL
ncbi:MAG: cobalt ECF transporter T component CbiQ [Deltaproteobacteria bacterium]|nr:cobalt ECF transporter T component CbiQ [Deltaproteobacteria bacterium]